MDSEVACWGRNAEGKLGYGVGADNPNPMSVLDVVGSSDSTNLDQLVSVTLGALHSCAWRAAGQVYCWGDDTFDQLGSGAPDDRTPGSQRARASAARAPLRQHTAVQQRKARQRFTIAHDASMTRVAVAVRSAC